MAKPRLPGWMTRVDRDILELLQNQGAGYELVMTPAVIAANLDWKSVTVREHVRELYARNLLQYYDEEKSLYQLSDRGRAWLSGELSTEELEAE